MGDIRTVHTGIIDVHLHCFAGLRDRDAILRSLGRLRAAGVSSMVVVGMVNTRLDAAAMWDIVPDFVENRGAADFNEADDLLEFTRLSDRLILPFVDTRHLWGDVTGSLRNYVARGFRGIKGIYLPDEGNDMGVKGAPHAFGITLEEYRQREWEIFSFAQEHDLPVLYHIDSRRYGEVMVEIIEDFPNLRINFPHLGISRKSFTPLLDRYPNLFTDIANLLPHMKNNPASYRDFILQYPDRVCLGSDAFLYETEKVLDYIEVVRELNLPEETESQVLRGNPARFLGSSLHGRAEVMPLG